MPVNSYGLPVKKKTGDCVSIVTGDAPRQWVTVRFYDDGTQITYLSEHAFLVERTPDARPHE